MLAVQPRTQQRALSLDRPAPIRGWNTRDPISAMQPGEAITLDNWFPDHDACRVRDGFDGHATGVGSGLVPFVHEWRGPAGAKLLAGGGGEIYNASSAGTASVITSSASYNSDEWQAVNFNGYTVACNGSDAPWHYDGSTLANSTWSGSGLTISNLINVAVYNRRLYFVEKNSASFWYGNVENVTGGTLAEFDLSFIAQKGGYLVAQAGWAAATGSGLQDFLVSVMSTGEVIVYEGDDPGSNWNLRGRYDAGEPIGRRCLKNIGGELVIITKSGYVPVSLLLNGMLLEQVEKDRVWGKIRAAVRDAAGLHADDFGWEAFFAPTGDRVFFNIPVIANQRYEQHVLNILTGAWCRYTGIPSASWASSGGVIYFGSTGGKVMKVSGANDDGETIVSTAHQAYDYFGDRSSKKMITAVKLQIAGDGTLQATLGVNADFTEVNFPANTVTFGASGSTTPWGSAWGSPWGTAPSIDTTWMGVGSLGRAHSLVLQTQTTAQSVSWYATSFLGQPGGIL